MIFQLFDFWGFCVWFSIFSFLGLFGFLFWSLAAAIWSPCLRFVRILVSLLLLFDSRWLPFGSIWFPSGSLWLLWLPFGSLWLPFGSPWLTVGSLWLTCCSVLLPWGPFCLHLALQRLLGAEICREQLLEYILNTLTMFVSNKDSIIFMNSTLPN